MIKAVFFQGGNIRRILIENREILMIATESNWVPVKLNVDKIESLNNLDNVKNSEKLKIEFAELIKESSKLQSEKDILEDITTDFHRTGWKRTLVQEVNKE